MTDTPTTRYAIGGFGESIYALEVSVADNPDVSLRGGEADPA